MVCGFKRRDAATVFNLYSNIASVGISVIDFGRLDEATMTCHFEIQFKFGGEKQSNALPTFSSNQIGFC